MKAWSRKAMLLLLFFISVVIAASKAEASTGKAVKIKTTYKYSNDKSYEVIKGIDSAGKTVWKYKTSKQIATELNASTAIVKGNYVYVIDNDTYIRLKKSNGKVVVKKKLGIAHGIYGAVLKVDKDKNLYAIGYYSNALYKISSKGKLLWTHTFPEEYFWAYKIRLSGKKVYVDFDCAGSPVTGSCKIKNGK